MMHLCVHLIMSPHMLFTHGHQLNVIYYPATVSKYISILTWLQYLSRLYYSLPINIQPSTNINSNCNAKTIRSWPPSAYQTFLDHYLQRYFQTVSMSVFKDISKFSWVWPQSIFWNPSTTFFLCSYLFTQSLSQCSHNLWVRVLLSDSVINGSKSALQFGVRVGTELGPYQWVVTPQWTEQHRTRGFLASSTTLQTLNVGCN